MSENSRKILIVEDEAVPGLLLQRKLEREGYMVTGVKSTGEDAVESAREDPPHLILMDIMLAGKIDGIQATRAIREFSAVPVIFITGYNLDRIKEQIQDMHYIAIYTKPYAVQDLIALVQSVLSEAERA